MVWDRGIGSVSSSVYKSVFSILCVCVSVFFVCVRVCVFSGFGGEVGGGN